jgi:hypothetical protein
VRREAVALRMRVVVRIFAGCVVVIICEALRVCFWRLLLDGGGGDQSCWLLVALVIATVLVVILGLQTCSDQERIDCNAVRTLKVVVDKDGLANQALGFVLVLGHDCIPEDWRWHATDKEDNPNPWPGPRMQP